ncbi:Hypothetical protein CpMEX30_2085 [Corynebacterium pseudotuberculosis]|nr:Hypothetical protein CpMEX30_2085 [Corynebacterium pseudotuberculosis]ATB62978.1 Hypothetical protein BFF96_2114 [Corynebacterium pseudotuberculosis]AUY61478.1 Hypothetical protein BFG00_2096 [Corynebacterium pseudotuberculosis]KEX87460.1 hypothetical protein CPTD_02214 [Corynebacterium pseudotuberculosis]
MLPEDLLGWGREAGPWGVIPWGVIPWSLVRWGAINGKRNPNGI